MNTPVEHSHIVHHFDQELAGFCALVLKMGGIACQQVRDACQALLNNQPSLAQMVIRREDWVDELEVEADKQMVHLLVKRQPAGPDLRTVLTLGRVVRDLERIGDEAQRIAQTTIEMHGKGGATYPGPQMLTAVEQMGRHATEMVEASLQLLEEPEVDAAMKVARGEHVFGEEFSAALRHIMTFVLEDSRNVGVVIAIALTLRSLERVGDHAQNIAEHVIYQVRGTDVRHMDASEAAEALRKAARQGE